MLPYVGPAVALPLFGALARLPEPVAVRVWCGLLAAALGALVVASLLLARTRRPIALVAAMLFGIASAPATSALALGQLALLSAAGIAGALFAYERRTRAVAVPATLIAGLQPNLALALIAPMRDRFALLCAAAAALAFAALTLATGGGMRGFALYLQHLSLHAGAERFVTIQYTPAALAWSLGAAEPVASAIGAACGLAAVAATVVVTVRARLDARDGTFLALAALPLAIPFFHEHDFVVELIPLLVLATAAQGSARAWAGVAAALICVDWFGLAQRPPAAGQIIALGCAVACAFVVLGRGARATCADAGALVATLALGCLALPLARAYPAPVWPDALPAAYRAPASADAAAWWADEQHAAGLDARRPVWGLLRALPLTGCVVLGVAIVAAARRRRAGQQAAAEA
jgi:Glycosyltransferase family 87